MVFPLLLPSTQFQKKFIDIRLPAVCENNMLFSTRTVNIDCYFEIRAQFLGLASFHNMVAVPMPINIY